MKFLKNLISKAITLFQSHETIHKNFVEEQKQKYNLEELREAFDQELDRKLELSRRCILKDKDNPQVYWAIYTSPEKKCGVEKSMLVPEKTFQRLMRNKDLWNVLKKYDYEFLTIFGKKYVYVDYLLLNT